MPERRGPKDGPSPDIRKKLEELEDKIEEPSQITRIKRLQDLQAKLEGAHKIDKLKNVEKKVILAQVVGIILFFPIIMFLNGLSLEPLYFPLYHSVLMVLIWTLILSIQAFMFKIIEIKRHGSYSSKHRAAERSIRRAVPVVIAALIVLAVIYTPLLTDKVNEMSSINERIELGANGSGNVELTNRGRLDFRILEDLTINPHGSDVHIRVYDKQTGEKIINREINETTTFEELHTNDFKELVLRVNSDEVREVRYRTTMEVIPYRRLSLTLISFFYVAIFSEWAALLYPIRKKYSGAGIYH